MSDTVSIRITADTSGVEAGIQQVRGNLGELKSTVRSTADSMSDGFAGMRGAVERSARSMDVLTASMRGLKPQEIASGLNELANALTDTSIAMNEEEFQAKVTSLRKQLDAAHGNFDEERKIGQQIVDATKQRYGETSKQALDAERQITDYLRREADERRRIQDDYFKHVAEMRHGEVDDAQAHAEFLNQMGLISDTQLLQQQQKFEDARYNIDRGELTRKLDLLKADPTTNPDVISAQNAKIEQLDQQHRLRVNENARKAALQRTQIERQAINQIAAGWAQGIAKMVTLQQGFTATIKGLWQTVQTAIGDMIARILEKWLAQEMIALATKIGLLKTETATTVEAESAKAGAGGTASMAAAPFPMNLAAAGFGASMAALAGSYASMAAFDVGAYDLSSDGIGMLHKGETIIPADQAGGWRNVMGLFASMPTFGVPSLGFGAGANSNAPAAANDGGVSGGGYHYHDHSARGLSEAQIIANRNAFAKAMKMAHREGKLGFSLPG